VTNSPVRQDPSRLLRSFTHARIGLGRAGASLPTEALLAFGVAHAQARDAVHTALTPDLLAAALRDAGLASVNVHSAATDRPTYLRRPDLGRRLDAASRAELMALRPARPPQAVFVLADGLSARAVQFHAAPVLIETCRLLQGWTVGPVVIARQARVALGDEIGELLGGELVAVLIGERPGLSSPDSLGIYLTYGPRVGRTDAERNCISNIRPAGLIYAEAARQLCRLMEAARGAGLTGVELKADPLPSAERESLPDA
jgi:ethanolamine ammonia-lyase small subunit